MLVTSTLCLAIAFYFSEKKHGKVLAKEKISLLLQHLVVANCGAHEAQLAIANKKAHDFEDALQYYSAVNDHCTCIVTSDLNDFYFSEIRVFTPEAFLKE